MEVDLTLVVEGGGDILEERKRGTLVLRVQCDRHVKSKGSDLFLTSLMEDYGRDVG